MRSLRTSCLALLALSCLATNVRAEDLLDRLVATNNFANGSPRGIVVTPDHAQALFLRSGARDRIDALYSLDLRTGEERQLVTAAQLLNGASEQLTPEERARRERLRMNARGLAEFRLSPDGTMILVPFSGRLFLVTRASGAVRELTPGTPAANDPRFSPDSRSIACVRDGALWVIDIASGTQKRLTPEEKDGITWGLPEFVAQEEMDRFEGYWWAPDSKSLCVQRTDETVVEKLSIADPFQPSKPPLVYAYPFPGKRNADVSLAVFPLAGGASRTITWDHERFPYLCRVTWSANGPLTILVMDRAQQHESLRAADVASGETRELLAESDPAWINLPEGAPRWLGAKDGFLWIAERDDTGPWLESRNADGSLRARLTPANLRVLRLLAVDAARAFAYVSATDDAREHHVYKVALKARMLPVRLGRERGIEDASFTEDAAVRVRTLLPERGAAVRTIEDASGKVLATPKSIAESPDAEPNAEFTRTGRDSFAVCIVRPHDFDPRKRYPVIDDAYGGPHLNQVQRAGRMLLASQWLADQGFIVVRIDGRGTPGRGRSWERAIRSDLISPQLADHVAALKSLCAEHPEMDGDKIGVTGGSFGGYFSVLAVERAPETYKAAYANAPVIDWHDYDTFYTERYLGVPPADSAAYTRSSALTDAAKLSRPLFVVHGTADDNVYFFNSLKLADALNRAGKDWRFMPMPGQTHGIRDPQLMRQNLSRRTQFFRESLGMPGDAAPPRP